MAEAEQVVPRSALVYVWDTLSPADLALVKAIMSDGRIVGAMHHAWAMGKRDGLERTFWIFRQGAGFGKGRTWTGTTDKTPLEAYNERLFLGDSLQSVVANYHTHPGSDWRWRYPSWQDRVYNRLSSTVGFLQSEFEFSFGRNVHLERRTAP